MKQIFSQIPEQINFQTGFDEIVLTSSDLPNVWARLCGERQREY